MSTTELLCPDTPTDFRPCDGAAPNPGSENCTQTCSRTEDVRLSLTHLVEAEVALEDGIAEPNFAEGVEEALVEVIRHPAPVLDLSEHVADTRPHHPLE